MRKVVRSAGSLLIAMILLVSLPLPATGDAPTGSIFLQIKSAAGSLVTPASVYITGLNGESGWGYPSFARGQETIWLEPGTYKISVTALGFEVPEPQTVAVKANQSQQVTFVLTPPAAPGKITGRVTDKETGAPIGGVKVGLMRDVRDRYGGGARIVNEVLEPFGAAVASGYDGAFAFSEIPPGTYTVVTGEPSVSGLWGGDYTGDAQVVVVQAGEESKVALTVARKGRISAVVRTDDGQPAQNAQVSIVPKAPGGTRYSLPGDSSGMVNIPVDPGEYTVTAGGPAYAQAAGQRMTVSSGQTAHITLTVGTVATGVLRGKLLSVSGAPIAGGAVTLADLNGNQVGKTVFTLGDGTFVYQPVAPGIYEVRVWASGYSRRNYGPIWTNSWPVGTVTISAGQTSILDLTLKRKVKLQVQVLGPDGKALPVWTLWSGNTQVPTETDDAGQVLAEVEEGDALLTARAPGHLPAEQKVRAGGIGEPTSLTFAMIPQSTGTIKGRAVAKESGLGMKGVHVELRMPGGVLRAAPPVKSGPDGSFTFTEVPAGTYELQGWGEGGMVSVDVTVMTGRTALPTLRMLPAAPAEE